MAEPGTVPAGTDLAAVVAGFGAALRAAGLPVGPERSERFARAIVLVRPRALRELRWCARATLAGDPAQVEVLDRVFDAVFGGLTDPADTRGDPGNPVPPQATRRADATGAGVPPVAAPVPAGAATAGTAAAGAARPLPVPSSGSEVDRLAGRDFAELSAAELAALREVMGRLRLATPVRRSRRTRRVPAGQRVDLRATLRRAHRTGADPVRLVRHQRRDKPRRLVVLCDISGSMEPYARAMLQLLYCAAGTRAEVFTFATRLTRLTRTLARARPAQALALAGTAAPDWSGGTRIGASLKDFLDRYGHRSTVRGAVVLIVSDGWETGDPGRLGEQMARLARLAYRIVWANPRTSSPRYRPLVGGMAAAWPYCDAVVSAHRLDALGELFTELGRDRDTAPAATGGLGVAAGRGAVPP